MNLPCRRRHTTLIYFPYPASTAEKLPAADELPAAPCVPVENGHTDSGSSSHSEEEELEVQVQMEKEGSEYESDDDLDSAFQSVTDVLEKQLLAEELLLKQQQQEAEELLQKQKQLLEEEMLQKRQQMLAQELLEKQQQLLREEKAKQDAIAKEGKNKIIRELEMKRALHEKQRLEIERLQREQQELEVALQKFENEVCAIFKLFYLRSRLKFGEYEKKSGYFLI